MAEPINLPFGLWTRVGLGCTNSIVFARWRQCALMGDTLSPDTPMCPHGRTHCHHLANTIEPSVYGGDAPCVKLL